MATKKKEAAPAVKVKKSPTVASGNAQLLKALGKSGVDRICRGGDVVDSYRYVDFVDPETGGPCLPLEYLFGTRGMAAGTIIKLEGPGHVGKTAVTLMLYGMAQHARSDSYVAHLESENTPPPPEFADLLGCDPTMYLLSQPHSVAECLQTLEKIIDTLRTAVDPGKANPIVVGIDSISGLSEKEKEAETMGSGADEKGAKAVHAKMFSRWFRKMGTVLSEQDVVLICTAQPKANIQMGPFPTPGAKTQVTLADAAFSYHASTGIKVRRSRWDVAGTHVGGTVTLSTWKNKLNQGDRTIRVNQWAVESKPDENKSVWDFGSATRAVLKQYLAGYQMLPGGWYRCPGVTETNKRWPDFSAALYENEELIYNLREQMRIKGYGFEFETKYQSARQGGKD